MEKIQLEERLQFVTILSLFFPVVVDALLRQGGSPSLSKIILSWGSMIAVLILSYILLESVKVWVTKMIPRFISIFLLVILASFAVILLLLSGLQAGVLPFFLLYIFALAINGLISLPVLILVLLLINQAAAYVNKPLVLK